MTSCCLIENNREDKMATSLASRVSLLDTESQFAQTKQGCVEEMEINTSSLNQSTTEYQAAGRGFIIIDPARKVFFVNKEAWFILAKGKEAGSGPLFLKALPREIQKALLPKPGGLFPPNKGVFQSGRRQYSVWAIPLYIADEKSNDSPLKQMLVILERISTEDPKLFLWARQFKFTPRENNVIKLLFRGRSDKLIGRALGISLETVREHMKNIRSKMGASSRLEVISLLLSA